LKGRTAGGEYEWPEGQAGYLPEYKHRKIYAKSEAGIAISVSYVPSESTLQITADTSGKQQ